MRRWAASAAISVGLLLAAVLGAGWHYSEQILTPGGGELDPEPVAVRAFDGSMVILAANPTSTRPGHYGLRFDQPAGAASEAAVQDGYALAGPVMSTSQGSVRRPVEPVRGDLGLADHVTFDGAYFPADPEVAFDFPVAQVHVTGELGRFAAYLDDQGSDTWLVFVHGRGSGPREGFRMLSIAHDLGLSSLLVSYRNDEGAPPSPGGRYGLGSTEWRDVQSAVRYATEGGAERVVVAGASMGGQIVTMFLHQAPEAEAVTAVVLDAPVLDWGPVLQQAARERDLPTWLTPVAMAVSQARGIPWPELNQVQRADEFDVPILVFHGTEDATVPIATSRAFARARPDLVSLVEVPEAGHVQAWNVDPAGYAAALRRFLAEAGVPVPAAAALDPVA